MSRRMWKVVKVKAGKARVAETERKRKEERSRKKTGRKRRKTEK